jgi:hypothetical protein
MPEPGHDGHGDRSPHGAQCYAGAIERQAQRPRISLRFIRATLTELPLITADRDHGAIVAQRYFAKYDECTPMRYWLTSQASVKTISVPFLVFRKCLNSASRHGAV